MGGDLEFSLIHQQATDPQLAFIASKGTLSKVATVRGMALTRDNTALVEVKAVDGNYLLYGTLALDGGMPLGEAIATKDGLAGAAVDPLLLGRLGLKLGDTVKLGNAEVQIRAVIKTEPDRLSDTLVIGPRFMISPATLDATQIVQPGSLVTYRYRVKLADASSLPPRRSRSRPTRASRMPAGASAPATMPRRAPTASSSGSAIS